MKTMGIVATHVGKSIGSPPTRILSDINLHIDDGEFVALTGRSGSGKSTLLYLLSSLDHPTEGIVEVSGFSVAKMSSEELSRFRNREMGFVFQYHYLIEELTALDNVLMPALKFDEAEANRAYAKELLNRFGLQGKAERMPAQLSGGEQQRVAIARALMMRPKYLFADEPTGSLDTLNAESVMEIIREANHEGTTVLMVTHDPDFAASANRQLHLTDGRLVSV